VSAPARGHGGRRQGPIVGVDVGGTTTAVGLVTRDGEVLADASAPTHGGGRDPLETIVGLITEVAGGAGHAARARAIAAVGVGVPATGEYAFPRALAATRIEMVPGDKRASVRGAAALVRYEQTVDRRRAR
jgi:N-acetylglucosamine kinase-like BadF-type ATPase